MNVNGGREQFLLHQMTTDLCRYLTMRLEQTLPYEERHAIFPQQNEGTDDTITLLTAT